MSHISKTDGCWKWLASKDRDGYGNFKIDGKVFRAHRISFELFNGEIPPGKLVCHTCDTPNCVNPDHLFLGTDLDNSNDKIAKGRDGQRKLTLNQIKYAQDKYKSGKVRVVDLAKELNTTPQAIGYHLRKAKKISPSRT